MTKEQKQYKGLIKADLKLALDNYDVNNIDIDVPSFIRNKADVITHWEAECRYYPVSVVRRDTIKKAYDITLEWLNSGDTK